MSARQPIAPPDSTLGLTTLALPSDDPGLPRRIGKYRILARLGDGATSEVFLAEDKFNARQVAIKRVRLASQDDSVGNHYR